VFSYTVIHHPAHPGVAASVPYNAALVEFPGLDGVRLLTNIVDAESDQLHIGIAVELFWEPHGSSFLPRFKRVEE
jgi:uncharacterized OB-fold protein